VDGLVAILHRVTQGVQNYKVIVFFTTARVTGFMAELVTAVGDFGEVLEIHSRKSQSQRTKTSDRFRKQVSQGGGRRRARERSERGRN
jgi:ATP-dependent RNA helicase MSS116